MKLQSNHPVVVVGLPRSGSTLLTAILNQSPDHYVLNDLYYLQLIDQQGSWDGFADLGQAEAAKALLRDMVRHRSAVFSPSGIANSAVMSAEQIEQALMAIDAIALADAGTGRLVDWAELIEAVITTAARVLGKTGWGWNTPQDYHHIDRILKRWPDARMIFLMRDPRATLKSYKYYPKRPAADRYHPVAQSIAWRNAARAWERNKKKYPDNMLLVRYEDIVSDTREKLRALNAFIPARIDEDLDLATLGSNSSYAGNGERAKPRTLAPIELWLSDAVLYRERVALGFDIPRSTFSLSGLNGMAGVNFRFLNYYGRASLSNPDTRQRIMRLLKPVR